MVRATAKTHQNIDQLCSTARPPGSKTGEKGEKSQQKGEKTIFFGVFDEMFFEFLEFFEFFRLQLVDVLQVFLVSMFSFAKQKLIIQNHQNNDNEPQ